MLKKFFALAITIFFIAFSATLAEEKPASNAAAINLNKQLALIMPIGLSPAAQHLITEVVGEREDKLFEQKAENLAGKSMYDFFVPYQIYDFSKHTVQQALDDPTITVDDIRRAWAISQEILNFQWPDLYGDKEHHIFSQSLGNIVKDMKTKNVYTPDFLAYLQRRDELNSMLQDAIANRLAKSPEKQQTEREKALDVVSQLYSLDESARHNAFFNLKPVADQVRLAWSHSYELQRQLEQAISKKNSAQLQEELEKRKEVTHFLTQVRAMGQTFNALTDVAFTIGCNFMSATQKTIELIKAVKTHNIEGVKKLVACGADPDKKMNGISAKDALKQNPAALPETDTAILKILNKEH